MMTPEQEPDPRIREPASDWVTPSPPAPPRPPRDEFADSGRPRSSGFRQEDLNHLRLLSIFHYVVAGMMALCAMFPVFHLAIGIGMVSGAFKSSGSGPPPPPAMGWMFIVMASAFMAMGWAIAIGLLLAGHFLRKQRHYLFCLITAGIACTIQPFGLVLGIFTIIVLIRPSVKALFEQNRQPAAVSSTRSA